MKLAVAVLSSILLACSVTTANPIDPSATTDVETSTSTFIPSATTSTEASTSPTPNPNGIGLGGLDQLPDSIKELLEKYVRLSHDLNQQGKICDPLKPEYDSQIMLVIDLKTKIEVLEEKSQTSGGSPEYDGEIQKTKLDLEAQRSKLEDIEKRYNECQLKKNGLESEIYLTKMRLVYLVFGDSSNFRLFDQQLYLINKHPSVKGYLGELSLEYSKTPGQSSSGQQHQESQPSSSRPSGSGSSRQKAPSNKRKRVSKLMSELKSHFKRPESEDREPLI
ncbi:hypothetical protein BATDEDRAFT_88146 [Batrachochytrium dendrobatidis JAM81]|uniref:Uncharacterized protein n=2 Tax=Batrachochytrium dendrobatidis TaxID=109871 RepID=F4P2B5_BATDJ|nr:uncharacterized protein BATDEDRAFT_88146 [Batrachochytrium dendrobatidis JAM81]EGF81085.1 hypothetical protein BATDEDRAFT_88146 [Batrachochytrium dendrobatidis JAM81]OAJ42046.1 hypothetical protein BDEG_25550 [Batrachochytrium dendrobatidis JEL423]|eukprot:XP_006678811.1 hypothetical protein BATDEDRAFT_88146 [Batrachochytrium dendrobatidis JAM81]